MVELGTVGGAYGLGGWARIRPHGGGEALKFARTWWLRRDTGGADGSTRDESLLRVEVEQCRRHGGGLIAKWSGWESPEKVDSWRGAAVVVSRADFPPAGRAEVYWVDLIGARVINRTGTVLGEITGLRNNGAQDLLEVQGEHGALLIPMIAPYVDEVDLAARCVRVDWQVEWSK